MHYPLLHMLLSSQTQSCLPRIPPLNVSLLNPIWLDQSCIDLHLSTGAHLSHYSASVQDIQGLKPGVIRLTSAIQNGTACGEFVLSSL
jgi:hypothetical protein